MPFCGDIGFFKDSRIHGFTDTDVLCIPPNSVLPGLRLEKRSPCFEMSMDQLATHGFYKSCKKVESYTGWLVSESSKEISKLSLTILTRKLFCLALSLCTLTVFIRRIPKPSCHNATTEQLRAAGTAHHRIKHSEFHLDSSLMIPKPFLKHFSGWCLSHRGNTFQKPRFHLSSPP